MLLIAESGSSKTQWRLINHTQQHCFESKGINPFFADESFVVQELNATNLNQYRQAVKKLIFYGAGCSNEDRNSFLKQIFQTYFPTAEEIIVDHDMLAACIALFGKSDGIACIIGTGSNSCVYQGGKIVQNVPALGYVLGDEASGGYIGKELTKHFIYKTLPKDIYQYFVDTYKLDKEDIFDAVYKKPLPNRFLASFAPVAYKFRQHPFIQEILKRGFDEFVQYHITCYAEAHSLPIGAVGSIAAVFEDEFNASLHRFNLKLHKIDKNPIDALVAFHT